MATQDCISKLLVESIQIWSCFNPKQMSITWKIAHSVSHMRITLTHYHHIHHLCVWNWRLMPIISESRFRRMCWYVCKWIFAISAVYLLLCIAWHFFMHSELFCLTQHGYKSCYISAPLRKCTSKEQVIYANWISIIYRLHTIIAVVSDQQHVSYRCCQISNTHTHINIVWFVVITLKCDKYNWCAHCGHSCESNQLRTRIYPSFIFVSCGKQLVAPKFAMVFRPSSMSHSPWTKWVKFWGSGHFLEHAYLQIDFLMYPDHLQKCLNYGHSLLIFAHLAAFWFSKTGQIWGFDKFSG